MTRTLWLLLALTALTLAAYCGAGACGFVGYDDPAYVTLQPMVNQGLRSAAIAWAFTAVHGANWHPLTSLSHMLDVTLFGVEPGAMHWVNVALHVLNTLLVFLVWQRLAAFHGRPARDSSGVWCAAFVAALFAWHPLHVESVAWISERKDVLSTAFWLGTILAYLRWTALRRSGGVPAARPWGALVVILTALALLAKPMTVTLPFTLLLLDFWPLRRWPAQSWRALVWEKAPLFVLSAALCVVTVRVQSTDGATDFGANLTFPMRVANATVSCARYLARTFWPEPLSPFFPHPGWWPWWTVAGSVVLLVALSWLAWRERERRPWLLFGWAWFLGTLVPVLGLVQVGAQSIADRYTYVPLLGLFTIVAWAGAEFAGGASQQLHVSEMKSEMKREMKRTRMRVSIVSVLAAGVLAGCLLATARAIPVWRDPFTLVAHMHAAIGDHFIVQRELGTACNVSGRPQEEIDAAYRRGLEIAPDYPFFLNELAVSAGRAGRFDEARALLERMREVLPGNAEALVAVAGLESVTGHSDAAIALIHQAIAMQPRLVTAHRLLAQVHIQAGRFPEARDALQAAVQSDRWDWVAVNELGVVLNHLGRRSEALECFERAHWIHPGDPNVVVNLKALRARPR